MHTFIIHSRASISLFLLNHTVRWLILHIIQAHNHNHYLATACIWQGYVDFIANHLHQFINNDLMHTFRDQEVVCSFWIIQPHSWFCTSFKHTIIISPSNIRLLHAWHCSMIGITCMFVDLSVMPLLLAEAKMLLWTCCDWCSMEQNWSDCGASSERGYNWINVSSTSGQNLSPSNFPETRKCTLNLTVNPCKCWRNMINLSSDVCVCVRVCQW